MHDRRRRLLKLLSDIVQHIAEAESQTVEAPEDEVMLRASELLDELRRALADVEQGLGHGQ